MCVCVSMALEGLRSVLERAEPGDGKAEKQSHGGKERVWSHSESVPEEEPKSPDCESSAF